MPVNRNEGDVRERLLRAARLEFLEKGFHSASLRKICQNADVTTGALYYFFQNKEDLFGALVEKPLRQFEQMAQVAAERELEEPSVFEDTEDQMICFLVANRDTCILLLDKAEGTRYANFRQTYLTWLEEQFFRFFQKYGDGKADRTLVHLISYMRFQGYLELLYGNYPLEQARWLAGEMGVYADAGFQALTAKMRNQDA